MYKKIVITGGNGFLGTSLVKHFRDRAETIVIVSRKPVKTSDQVMWEAWDGKSLGTWSHALEGADAVINLAGKNVDCRYTQPNREAILSSRLNSTEIIGEAIAKCIVKPRLWINASSATIYNASFDKLMTEADGDIGNDFSMSVCKQWEKAFNSFRHLGVRQVAMRISIVLGWEGAALPALRNLTRFGLGGHQGDGQQFCSWIHVYDFCRAVEWFVDNDSATGPFNVTSPVPLTNLNFMSTLREKLGVPAGLPAPAWLLEIGAFFIRTETELVLKSRKVYPKKLLDNGFVFRFENLDEALTALTARI